MQLMDMLLVNESAEMIIQLKENIDKIIMHQLFRLSELMTTTNRMLTHTQL